ncbi:unnamed protein product [Ceratitis capitata]|uniref:(Mediterranean fruit fly) hypothetical protein n=1 Tax=Ceratitis capitata TaxID=7213 RepID=A0A811UXI6_CERCA|nr:unnamed protein product [Ceratitis capitata]
MTLWGAKCSLRIASMAGMPSTLRSSSTNALLLHAFFCFCFWDSFNFLCAYVCIYIQVVSVNCLGVYVSTVMLLGSGWRVMPWPVKCFHCLLALPFLCSSTNNNSFICNGASEIVKCFRL